MNKKKKKKMIKKIKKFFKSVNAVILALIIMVVVLLTFCRHLMISSKTYMFSGQSDNVTILNGVISLNHDVNLLQGSHINYVGEEDIIVTEYKIGYYVTKDNALLPLVTRSGEDEEGLSLSGVLSEISSFNITEPYFNETFFSKDVINSLEDGLYFIIEGKTETEEEILDKIELSLSKVSK